MRALSCCVLVLCSGGGLSAGEPKPEPLDTKKLVGRWEAKGDPEKRLVVFEFAGDGGLVVCITRKGEESKATGTYRVEAEKLTMTLKLAGVDNTRTVTITKFTDEQLLGTGEQGQLLLLVRQREK